MSQWAVAEFMSRMANRVNSAKEDFAAQLVGHRTGVMAQVEVGPLDDMFPFVEPSPEFVATLRQQLLDAVVEIPAEVIETSSMATRRVLYGLAAIGSLASAAAIAVVVYRSRGSTHRQAA